MFKELVFYLEACESGSMFPNLTADESIYAMTASNASLSSWAAYCGGDAVVNGKSINSCLGDLFSINWMEDTDAANVKTETLKTQQATVIAKTTASPVQTFGDFSFLSEAIGDFEGNYDVLEGIERPVAAIYDKFRHMMHEVSDTIFEVPEPSVVDSRDHDLHFLMNVAVNDPAQENIDAVHKEILHRNRMDAIFNDDHFMTPNAPEIPQNFDCLRMMVNEVEDMCGEWSAYSLKYVRKLANICDTRSEEQVAESVAKIYELCNN